MQRSNQAARKSFPRFTGLSMSSHPGISGPVGRTEVRNSLTTWTKNWEPPKPVRSRLPFGSVFRENVNCSEESGRELSLPKASTSYPRGGPVGRSSWSVPPGLPEAALTTTVRGTCCAEASVPARKASSLLAFPAPQPSKLRLFAQAIMWPSVRIFWPDIVEGDHCGAISSP